MDREILSGDCIVDGKKDSVPVALLIQGICGPLGRFEYPVNGGMGYDLNNEKEI